MSSSKVQVLTICPGFQVATSSLDNSLLKYGAKEYFFRAALCHLCIDPLNAQHALERYVELCPAFQDSREYKFVKVEPFPFS